MRIQTSQILKKITVMQARRRLIHLSMFVIIIQINSAPQIELVEHCIKWGRP